MHLLILNGPASLRCSVNPRYRGTHRAVPSHCDAVPDDDEINRLFVWYLREGGEEGIVGDAAKALRFAELWNARLPKSEQFEVVEVIEGNMNPSSGGTLLGFDISSGLAGYSLLAGWLSEVPKVEDLPDAIWELSNLLSRYYTPQLNEFLLRKGMPVVGSCWGLHKKDASLSFG